VLPDHSVCEECKRHGNVCVTVAHGTPCLGPVTLAGCGALCPKHQRGCYGCFGPAPSANPQALSARMAELGQSPEQIVRLYRGFNTNAPAFRDESARLESASHES
jgi:coenzyme F420-reducing hydrogenase gamma subunit